MRLPIRPWHPCRGWPDVSSHFGSLDIAGFEKDLFYWYRAHLPAYAPGTGMVRLLGLSTLALTLSLSLALALAPSPNPTP